MADSASQKDIKLAESLLREWDDGQGTSKSQIEIRVWGDATAHGRRFDRFIRRTLGLSTTKPSKQTDRIEELQRQITAMGEVPVGDEPEPWRLQILQARKAALASLRAWNDPLSSFRTEAFSLLFVTAWNSVALAMLMRDGKEWRQLGADGEALLVDGMDKAQDTAALVAAAFRQTERSGLRKNVDFWLRLRNQVAHRHFAALDLAVIPFAQAGLLNLEDVLSGEFGGEHSLGDALSVPLQLTGFRDPSVMASFKRLQAQLPSDLQAFLAQATDGPEELLADSSYWLRVAFLPTVPSSGRSPDAVAYFIRPGEVPDGLVDALDQYVVIPKVIRAPRPNLIATQVIEQVRGLIPYRFTMPMHTEATYRLGARSRPDDPPKVDPRYCEYVTSVKRHLYSDNWVKRLAEELRTSEGFEATTGRPAVAIHERAGE